MSARLNRRQAYALGVRVRQHNRNLVAVDLEHHVHTDRLIATFDLGTGTGGRRRWRRYELPEEGGSERLSSGGVG